MDISMTEIELYEILKSKVGEKEARSLVEYVETRVEKKLAEKKDVLATKEDLANLKADIIKWMFLFWIGQLASLIAILQIFFKH
jgi:demethoxyubiquinone hydroxylase (CLK1/Coq7/Cat5 family)